ncbi:MAG: ABC transporter ATP-binding protein [Candidatus Krumholzibacteriia bacterium]
MRDEPHGVTGVPVLEVRGLRKVFGELIAVDGISFAVRQGEIFGFLGPNGAGKTTSISMICGLLTPTDGEILVDGRPARDDPRGVKRRLGVVPQEVALYEDLSARENLEFWGGIYGLRGADLRARIATVLEQVGLGERAREPIKRFSGGMKRRLNLAMGLIHDPRLILLDEPTVGIDPQARHNILEVVREVVRAGRTVLYTTHYLEEAESLCDRLAIIDHGRILAQGTVAELKSQLGEGSLLTLQGGFAAARLGEVVAKIDGLSPLEVGDGRALLLVARDSAGVGHALEALYRADLAIEGVTIKEPSLEDLFLKLTGRELRD